MNLWHLVNERNDIAKELHKSADTHALACTYAEYWEYRTCNKTLADTLTQFVFCQSLCLEVFLHQTLVILSGSLNKSSVKLHCLVLLLSRDFLDSRRTAFRSP